MMNISKPIRHVKHSELTRITNSKWRSRCIVCEEGILLVARAEDKFMLMARDICVLCGQRYIYKDINDMRKQDDLLYQ